MGVSKAGSWRSDETGANGNRETCKDRDGLGMLVFHFLTNIDNEDIADDSAIL